MSDGPARESGQIDWAELLLNPIWVKSVRSRLRLKHVLSWGLVSFTITAFVSVVTYLPAVERGTSAENAAKLMIIPIIFIQGVLLMLLGAGAVASQLSIEREKGLLDYQRMTPMSPHAKILGYLFGLPVREYFLFALTLPFLAFAVVVGGINPLKMAHFYVVFFSSVFLYHMTAMVAGMASSKPRHAAMMSQGLVVLLYVVLPQLSRFGTTFFEFLTVRPTFFAMVSQEIEAASPGLSLQAGRQFSGLNQAGSVPFFSFDVHSTIFSLMVQLFLLAVLYQVVRRKWRDEFSHSLGKLDAMLMYAGVALLLLGSLWPALGDPIITDRLRSQFGDSDVMPPREFLYAATLVFLLVAGVTLLLVIALVTPNRYTQLRALRRSRKLGLPRVPMLADGAGALTATLVACALAAGAYVLLLRHADDSRQFLASFGPLWSQAAPMAYFVSVAIFTHAVRERFSGRAFGVSTFLLWMIPFFVAIVLVAAFEAFVAAGYVSMLCPPLGLGLVLANLFEQATPLASREPFMGDEVGNHLPTMVMMGIVFYGGLAGVFQFRLRAWKRSLREQEQAVGAQAGLTA